MDFTEEMLTSLETLQSKLLVSDIPDEKLSSMMDLYTKMFLESSFDSQQMEQLQYDCGHFVPLLEIIPEETKEELFKEEKDSKSEKSEPLVSNGSIFKSTVADSETDRLVCFRVDDSNESKNLSLDSSCDGVSSESEVSERDCEIPRKRAKLQEFSFENEEYISSEGKESANFTSDYYFHNFFLDDESILEIPKYLNFSQSDVVTESISDGTEHLLRRDGGISILEESASHRRRGTNLSQQSNASNEANISLQSGEVLSKSVHHKERDKSNCDDSCDSELQNIQTFFPADVFSSSVSRDIGNSTNSDSRIDNSEHALLKSCSHGSKEENVISAVEDNVLPEKKSVLTIPSSDFLRETEENSELLKEANDVSACSLFLHSRQRRQKNENETDALRDVPFESNENSDYERSESNQRGSKPIMKHLVTNEESVMKTPASIHSAAEILSKRKPLTIEQAMLFLQEERESVPSSPSPFSDQKSLAVFDESPYSNESSACGQTDCDTHSSNRFQMKPVGVDDGMLCREARVTICHCADMNNRSSVVPSSIRAYPDVFPNGYPNNPFREISVNYREKNNWINASRSDSVENNVNDSNAIDGILPSSKYRIANDVFLQSVESNLTLSPAFHFCFGSKNHDVLLQNSEPQFPSDGGRIIAADSRVPFDMNRSKRDWEAASVPVKTYGSQNEIEVYINRHASNSSPKLQNSAADKKHFMKGVHFSPVVSEVNWRESYVEADDDPTEITRVHITEKENSPPVRHIVELCHSSEDEPCHDGKSESEYLLSFSSELCDSKSSVDDVETFSPQMTNPCRDRGEVRKTNGVNRSLPVEIGEESDSSSSVENTMTKDKLNGDYQNVTVSNFRRSGSLEKIKKMIMKKMRFGESEKKSVDNTKHEKYSTTVDVRDPNSSDGSDVPLVSKVHQQQQHPNDSDKLELQRSLNEVINFNAATFDFNKQSDPNCWTTNRKSATSIAATAKQDENPGELTSLRAVSRPKSKPPLPPQRQHRTGFVQSPAKKLMSSARKIFFSPTDKQNHLADEKIVPQPEDGSGRNVSKLQSALENFRRNAQEDRKKLVASMPDLDCLESSFRHNLRMSQESAIDRHSATDWWNANVSGQDADNRHGVTDTAGKHAKRPNSPSSHVLQIPSIGSNDARTLNDDSSLRISRCSRKHMGEHDTSVNAVIETDLDTWDSREILLCPEPTLDHSMEQDHSDKTKSLLYLYSNFNVNVDGVGSNNSRAKSVEFLLDESNKAAIQPPENELKMKSEKKKSEYELRIERSLQNLDLPDWYKNAVRKNQLGSEGFFLDKKGSNDRDSEHKPRWEGFRSKTSSFSSLQKDGNSSSNYATFPAQIKSPEYRHRTASQKHRTEDSLTVTSPGARHGSFSSRLTTISSLANENKGKSLFTPFRSQPYLGWRSQEVLSRNSSICVQQQTDKESESEIPSIVNSGISEQESHVQDSIKEVTNAIVHFCNETEDATQTKNDGKQLSPNDDSFRSRKSTDDKSFHVVPESHKPANKLRPLMLPIDDAGPPRPRRSKKLWIESSFVGSKPLHSPDTPKEISAAKNDHFFSYSKETVAEDKCSVDKENPWQMRSEGPISDEIRLNSGRMYEKSFYKEMSPYNVTRFQTFKPDLFPIEINSGDSLLPSKAANLIPESETKIPESSSAKDFHTLTFETFKPDFRKLSDGDQHSVQSSSFPKTVSPRRPSSTTMDDVLNSLLALPSKNIHISSNVPSETFVTSQEELWKNRFSENTVPSNEYKPFQKSESQFSSQYKAGNDRSDCLSAKYSNKNRRYSSNEKVDSSTGSRLASWRSWESTPSLNQSVQIWKQCC